MSASTNKGATQVMVAIAPAPDTVPQQFAYTPLPSPSPNPLVRFGLDNEDRWSDPNRCLLQLSRWNTELLRREGGDVVGETWYSFGYSLKEARLVAVGIAKFYSCG